MKCSIRRLGQKFSAVDLFCGAGGLTHGLAAAGLQVNAGIDIDPACQFPFEKNNGAKFHRWDIAKVSGCDLASLYPRDHLKILVGCAPCQPFSRYAQGDRGTHDGKWKLLNEFARLIREVRPSIVSMENVPELQNHRVFQEFCASLKSGGYFVSVYQVYCPDYGIPQTRTRLVLFASESHRVELIKPTHVPAEYVTVRQAIGQLPAIEAGGEDTGDPLHKASRLSPRNLKRIKASAPGGTWRDWPETLKAKCHSQKSGETYPSVYGRMEWDLPAPTITTQFFGFGNGRFGHPKQHRAISLREGAILQSFPQEYAFVPTGDTIWFSIIGRMIGNAVPVRLGYAVGRSILEHIQAFQNQRLWRHK